MRAWRLLCQLGILGGVTAAAIHCGSDEGSSFPDPSANTAACTTAYAGRCGAACTDDTSCGAGLYCNASKVCTADCAPSVACADTTASCTASGFCSTGGGFLPDDGGISTEGGTLLPDGGFCGDIDVTLAKTEPAVLFLLDQSSSMIKYKVGSNALSDNDCATNNDCRWTALKDALIGRTTGSGLIFDLQHTALMSIAMYSATDNKSGDSSYLGSSVANPEQVCPRFNGKKFAGLTFSDDNYTAVDNLLRPSKVDDDTPTGEAIRAVVGLPASGATATDPKGFALTDVGTSPKVLVLVTDGEAGYCVDATKSVSDADQIGTDRTVLAVQQAYALKIPTYVIALGGPAQANDFKAIANAGQGKAANGDAVAFAPANTAALKTQLNTIVTNARSCTFALNGEATGDGSKGTVLVNGQVVPFGTQWHLATPSSIELLGAACTTVKTDPNATLKATFPCGSISIGPK